MKQIVVRVLAGWLAFAAWERLRGPAAAEPLYDTPYVVVYGRDTCGLTQNMRSELARLGVPHDAVEDPLHARMQHAGISTARYMLPVVDVSGRLFVSPEAAQVADAWRSAPAEASP